MLKKFRKTRILAAAQAAGADVLVATLPENLMYLCDDFYSVSQRILYDSQCFAVLDCASGEVTILCPVADLPSIFEVEGMEARVVCFGSFRFDGCPGPLWDRISEASAERYPSAEDALIGVLKGRSAVVAIDEGRIRPQNWDKCVQALPEAKIIPGKAIFAKARMVKHPQEIELLRFAAQASEQSLLEMLAAVRPGVTERGMERSYGMAMYARGAEPTYYVGVVDERTAFSDTRSTGLAVRSGSLLRFDFGGNYHGYRADLARTAVCGPADPRAEAAYAAVEAGAKAAIAAVRPGRTADEIFRIAVQETRRAGLPDYARHHCGHGIGLEMYDHPSICAGNDCPLEEDMVLCIETPYYAIGWGGVQIEHTIRVTVDGAEFLDSGDSSLIRLG